MSDEVPTQTKPIIGLAGGIAAGKSVVAGVFADLGAAVIDSDRLNHEELQDPEVISTLRSWWGDGILDESGGVSRKALADVVFEDPAALKRLEEFMYPRLARRRDSLLQRHFADEHVVAIVLDAPKLFEAGLDRLCDVIVFVDAARGLRLARLARGRGWTEEELDRRENQQNRLDNKKARADYIVENNSRIETLRPSIERILASVLQAYKENAGGGTPKR